MNGSCPEGKYLNGTMCLDCSDDCKTCQFEESNCTTCSEIDDKWLHGSECIDSCPTGTMSFGTLRMCLPCSSGCTDCWWDDSNAIHNGMQCTQCENNIPFIIWSNIQFCTADCGESGFLDPGTNTCTNCGCTYGCDADGLCYPNMSCPGVQYQNQCLTSCPSGTYNDSNICKRCYSSCKKCSTGPGICSECFGTDYLIHFLK